MNQSETTVPVKRTRGRPRKSSVILPTPAPASEIPVAEFSKYCGIAYDTVNVNWRGEGFPITLGQINLFEACRWLVAHRNEGRYSSTDLREQKVQKEIEKLEKQIESLSVANKKSIESVIPKSEHEEILAVRAGYVAQVVVYECETFASEIVGINALDAAYQLMKKLYGIIITRLRGKYATKENSEEKFLLDSGGIKTTPDCPDDSGVDMGGTEPCP